MGRKYRFKTKPDPHQLVGLKRALKHERYGIFFEQRGGKTKVAIDFCGALNLKKGVKRVLIVCPLSVRGEWEDQLADHMTDDVKYECHLYPNTPTKRQKLMKEVKNNENLTFIIVNYDKIPTEIDRLARWNADVIIFDEAHLLKNAQGKWNKRCHRLSVNATYVLGLTGTPIAKRPTDLFGLFKVLDDRVFGTRWVRFRDRYCVMGGYMGKEVVGYRNTEELSEKVAQHSMRVLRKDIFDEPEVDNVVIKFPLEAKAQRIYDKLKSVYLAELEDGVTITADMAGVRCMRLQQVCGGWIPDDEGGMQNVSNAKTTYTADLVKTAVACGESVVVFHRFSAEGDALYERLAKAKVKVAQYNGQTSEQDREERRKGFQAGEIDVIIIQISTGVMGISLDRARTNVFMSLDYSLGNFKQARDRIMGRNQQSDFVTSYFMAAEGSVDYKVMKTLKKDEDLAIDIGDRWKWLLED